MPRGCSQNASSPNGHSARRWELLNFYNLGKDTQPMEGLTGVNGSGKAPRNQHRLPSTQDTFASLECTPGAVVSALGHHWRSSSFEVYDSSPCPALSRVPLMGKQGLPGASSLQCHTKRVLIAVLLGSFSKSYSAGSRHDITRDTAFYPRSQWAGDTYHRARTARRSLHRRFRHPLPSSS